MLGLARRDRPSPREDVIHDQHGHVAANSVALLSDLMQRLDHRGAQGRGKALSWTHRPCREVGVAAIGKDSTANLDKRRRIPLQVRGGARHEHLRLERCPWMIGSHMIGHEVKIKPMPRAANASCAGRPRSTEMIIDNIATYAVWRSDDICGLPIRKSLSSSPAGPFDKAMATPAGLRCQTPISHGVESKIGYFIPITIGNRSRSIAASSFLLIASSQGQVLIS